MSSDQLDLEVGFSEEGEVLVRVGGEGGVTVGVDWLQAVAVGQEITAMGTLVAQIITPAVPESDIAMAATRAATVASAGARRILRGRQALELALAPTEEEQAAAVEGAIALTGLANGQTETFDLGSPIELGDSGHLDVDCPCEPFVVPVPTGDMLVHREDVPLTEEELDTTPEWTL